MAALRERNRLSREPVAQPPAQSSTSPESTIIPSREPLPPGPEGRARLLETLRVKSRQQLAAPADRARALAKLGSIAGKSSSGGVSAPSSSPPHSTTSPENTLDMSTSVFLPREEKSVGRGVTQMTGGLEWLKMGEMADEPPVVMKGTAGTAVKLGTKHRSTPLCQTCAIPTFKLTDKGCKINWKFGKYQTVSTSTIGLQNLLGSMFR